MIEELEKKIKYLEKAIEEKNREIEIGRAALLEFKKKYRDLMKEMMSKRMLSDEDRKNYGKHEYWTAKRLYELKRVFPEMSYRTMEKRTGIPKSTIQKKIEKYGHKLSGDSLRIEKCPKTLVKIGNTELF